MSCLTVPILTLTKNCFIWSWVTLGAHLAKGCSQKNVETLLWMKILLSRFSRQSILLLYLWMKWKYYVGFTMVKAGALKNIAVQSPRGNLATASNIPRRRKPPRTPWAATLHLVAKSGVPRMWCLPQMMMGSIDNNWETHRTNRSCQEFTSGMYFTITLLEQDNNRQLKSLRLL